MCYAVYGLLDDVGIAELRAVDDVAAVLGQEPLRVSVIPGQGFR